MKQISLKFAAIFSIALGSLSISEAQSSVNVVTTAVPFLRISPDARGGGMGETGIATAADAYSGFWNIAKIPFADKKINIAATYTPWLSDLQLHDVYLATLSGYYQIDDIQAVSSSLRYFSLGNIQFTNENGELNGEGRPREFAIDAGYSRKLSSKLSLGIALRYIYSNLADGAVSGGTTYQAGTSVAGDLHMFYKGTNQEGNGFDYGLTLSNLGSKIAYTNDANKKDYIPANLGIGATYNKVFDADNKLSVAMDLNKLLVPTPPASTSAAEYEAYRSKSVMSSWFSSLGDGDDLKEITVSLGAEYWYQNQFAFRAGYFYEDASKGDRKYFTLGAGLKYSTFGIDFAYLLPSGSGVSRNPLSNTMRFGITFDLDNK